MELETNNARAKPFRTKNYLTQPQLDINNAIHNYTKQMKLLTHRTSGTTTILPIKNNNVDYNMNANNQNSSKSLSKLLNNKIVSNKTILQATTSAAQLNEGNKVSSSLLAICTSPIVSNIKMNSNFIYPISHQHRLINNVSSFSDQTNMASTQIKLHNLIENNENKILRLRSQTSQSSANNKDCHANVNQNINNNINIQKTSKKPLKLKPLLKTTSFKVVGNVKLNSNTTQVISESNIDAHKLQYIDIHKPIQKPLKLNNLNNICEETSKQHLQNKYNLLNDNKLALFDANKLINTAQKNKNSTSNNSNALNDNFYKWSFNNNNSNGSTSSIKDSTILTTITNRNNFNDTITNSLKNNDNNNKTTKLPYKKHETMKYQLDDIDEDYMDNMYTKSILEKINMNPNYKNESVKLEALKSVNENDDHNTYDIDDSDNDTLVSNSSLLSTSDKSCEIIYLCPISHKIEEQRHKTKQLKKSKLKFKNKQQVNIKPEDRFLNNHLTESSSEDEFFIQKNNVNIMKSVKKNILTSLNKRLSANSNIE